jgi:hypothetical protein
LPSNSPTPEASIALTKRSSSAKDGFPLSLGSVIAASERVMNDHGVICGLDCNRLSRSTLE